MSDSQGALFETAFVLLPLPGRAPKQPRFGEQIHAVLVRSHVDEWLFKVDRVLRDDALQSVSHEDAVRADDPQSAAVNGKGLYVRRGEPGDAAAECAKGIVDEHRLAAGVGHIEAPIRP